MRLLSLRLRDGILDLAISEATMRKGSLWRIIVNDYIHYSSDLRAVWDTTVKNTVF